MKIEDFPLVEFKGHRLLIVPELPRGQEDSGKFLSCRMCIAERDAIGTGMCAKLRHKPRQEDCGYHESGLQPPAMFSWKQPGFIYLPEERFEEYVIELVRRRIS